MEYRKGEGKLSSGKVPKMPWRYPWLANCTRVEDSEYDEDGADVILGPAEALPQAHQ